MRGEKIKQKLLLVLFHAVRHLSAFDSPEVSEQGEGWWPKIHEELMEQGNKLKSMRTAHLAAPFKKNLNGSFLNACFPYILGVIPVLSPVSLKGIFRHWPK